MSRHTTPQTAMLFGEVRSLEHALDDVGFDARLGLVLGELDELDEHADPEEMDALRARLAALFIARLEPTLASRGWVGVGENVYTCTTQAKFLLVGILSPGTRTFGVVCPPRSGCSTPQFIECLGVARGLEQIEGMLACIEAEFSTGETVVELDEATILRELERRRAYISNLDPELFDVAASMASVCAPDDYIAWSEEAGRTDAGRYLRGGEVRCFAEWEEGAQVYDPALSTHGDFDDDCSSIWVARSARFESSEQARDWARSRAGRAPAYYRLSPEWRFLCSGKTFNKYSDPY